MSPAGENESVEALFDLAPGARVWVGGHDREARRAVERLVGSAWRLPRGPIDAAFVTPESVDEAEYFADKALSRLSPEGRVWVVYSVEGGSVLDVARLKDKLGCLGLQAQRDVQVNDAIRCVAFRRAGR